MNEIEYFEKFKAGVINDSESFELFSNLAESNELRENFKSFMFLSDKIEKHIEAIAIDNSTKGRIFAASGMGSNPANAGALAAPVRSMMFFVLGALLPFLFSGFYGINLSSEINKPEDKKYTTVSTEADNYLCQKLLSPNLLIQDKEVKNKSMNRFINITISSSDREEQLKNPDANNQYSETKISNNEGINENYILNASMVNEKITGNYGLQKQNNLPLNVYPYSNLSGIFPILSNFSLELKNYINYHFQNETISPGKINAFNNMNLILFYNVTPKLKAGIDLKQETFMVKYEGNEESGRKFEYYQQPNLTSVGIIGHYSFTEKGLVNPYIRAGLGINRAGIVSKAGLGLKYDINSAISVTAGLEYQNFIFKHNNIFFNTNKIGLNYGLAYNL